MVKFASGSPEWFPYDVGTNLIRNADHTRIHLDVSDDNEKEWTFLVYLTPNWTRNYYGETAFFERNSDDTEIVAEVRPRYGRAVIFQGTPTLLLSFLTLEMKHFLFVWELLLNSLVRLLLEP